MLRLTLLSLSLLCLTPQLLPAQQAAVSKVEANGGRVMKLAQNDDRLEVTFHLAEGEISDKSIQPVSELTQVYLVNLRGTAITDAGLAHLSGLDSLSRLHLEKPALPMRG